MFRKIATSSILICSAVFCLTSLSSAADSSNVVVQAKKDTLLSLTIGDLAMYDGKNGNKAYIAVDSVIYDVSNSKSWKNGEHKRGTKAGFDHSESIMKSPHGKSVIKKLKIVGKLIPTVKAAVAPMTPATPAAQ